MSQSLRPLVVAADIASEATQQEILAAITALSERIDALVSEDAIVAAEVAAEETDIVKLTTAVNSMQALVVALQAEVAAGGLSPATMTALAKVQADLATVRGTAESDMMTDTAHTPPSGV